ncbi:MAG: hypothetical protein Q9160_009079 [Pyrenula sp. 1 TL-2023]
MPSYLITGANRGLGLEFARQLSAIPSNTIIATCRTPFTATDLSTLSFQSSNIHILTLDISSEDSIKALFPAVGNVLGGPDGVLDYLINNAGINSDPTQSTFSMTSEALRRHIDVNVYGPAAIVRGCSNFLVDGSVVMNMSSGLGSMGMKNMRCTTYAISKAALNMLTVHQDGDLGGENGVRVVCMDPGWVRTEMGGEGAELEPEESVSGVLKVLGKVRVDASMSGRFWRYDGEEMPW